MKRAEQPKIAVFACGLDASSTETKGTVLIRTGEELMSYNKVCPEMFLFCSLLTSTALVVVWLGLFRVVL